jgi:hypothetical protein
MKPVTYGVQIEFTVDSILDGGPSKATIREALRRQVEQLASEDLYPRYPERFGSLRDVRVRYLHEATNTQEKK